MCIDISHIFSIDERKAASEMKLLPFVSIQNVLIPNIAGRNIDDIINLDVILDN